VNACLDRPVIDERSRVELRSLHFLRWFKIDCLASAFLASQATKLGLLPLTSGARLGVQLREMSEQRPCFFLQGSSRLNGGRFRGSSSTNRSALLSLLHLLRRNEQMSTPGASDPHATSPERNVSFAFFPQNRFTRRNRSNSLSERIQRGHRHAVIYGTPGQSPDDYRRYSQVRKFRFASS